MQLSVIIVSYNVKYFLEQCLLSVLKACAGIDAEVFVEDNHSTDGSREWLETKFPTVHFNWANTNDGFGKANNRALKKATGDYVLFLNPDTIVAEDCFSACISFFKQTTYCGALGVRMIDGSGRFLKESKRGLPSPRASFFKMSGLSKLFPSSKLFAEYHAGHLPEFTANKTAVLAGAFMMLSRKAIEKTTGFDEDFFMYGEDVDLSYRIKKAQLDNYYFPGTTIIHFKGESTQRLSAGYVKHFYGAMKRFVNKHYKESKFTYYSMLFAISVSRMLAGVKLFFQQKFGSTTTSAAVLNTAVVADHTTFNRLIHLLKFAKPAVVISGRIAATEEDKETSLGTIHDLPSTISRNNIRQVVFCEENLSFKEIITAVEKVNKKTRSLFHAKGSKSIVGSNDKNARGVFIAEGAA